MKIKSGGFYLNISPTFTNLNDAASHRFVLIFVNQQGKYATEVAAAFTAVPTDVLHKQIVLTILKKEESVDCL